MSIRVFAVKPGNGFDLCRLCGISRRYAGFNPATCGLNLAKSNCFIDEADAKTKLDQLARHHPSVNEEL